MTHVLVYVGSRKKIEGREEAAAVILPTNVACPLSEPRVFLWEAPVCKKLISKLVSNWTKKIHSLFVPNHVTMPSFMNFRLVLDLLEFKNQESQCLRSSHDAEMFEIAPISCMGPKHAPKDTYMIFQAIFGALLHVPIVQI